MAHRDLEEHNLPLSSPFSPTLIFTSPQASASPTRPRQHQGTHWRKEKAQHRSPLPSNHSPPKNRFALAKAGVILLTAPFPTNCSKKGTSAEPGNPSSWGETTPFLQKGYSSAHLECDGSYLNPDLIIFHLLVSYLPLFHFFTLNKSLTREETKDVSDPPGWLRSSGAPDAACQRQGRR